MNQARRRIRFGLARQTFDLDPGSIEPGSFLAVKARKSDPSRPCVLTPELLQGLPFRAEPIRRMPVDSSAYTDNEMEIIPMSNQNQNNPGQQQQNPGQKPGQQQGGGQKPGQQRQGQTDPKNRQGMDEDNRNEGNRNTDYSGGT